MRRCCIIYNEPGKDALADELDVIEQVDHIAEHLVQMGYKVDRKGITDRFMDEIPLLAAEKYEFVYKYYSDYPKMKHMCSVFIIIYD